jgi:thiosulfate reductase cytochrome b subunit
MLPLKNMTMDDNKMDRRPRKLLVLAGMLLLVSIGVWGAQAVFAKPSERSVSQISPIHPAFELLDQNGINVLETGNSVSTSKTCDQCHDADFIATHSFHADLGLSAYRSDGFESGTATWNTSGGLFGKFDSLSNRYLSQVGDERLDLTTPEWLMLYAARIPGGGPAVLSRDGLPLTSLPPDPANPETAVRNPKTGVYEPWNWAESGIVEMNCFLCHTPQPNQSARVDAIRSGEFARANTASLLGTGIVTAGADGWQYNPEAFDETGKLKEEYVLIQDPTNDNCAQCHGVVHTNLAEPLVLDACSLEQIHTATSGQVISPARINDSGLNLTDKASLSRSWDVHAERALTCTDCHYSLNNPQHYLEAAPAPAHLTYDPRRLDIGEYLQRPDHNLARGESAQSTGAVDGQGEMRRCESCHAAEETHSSWLPYTARHMETVACESCHIPRLYAPAIQSYDWTVIRADGSPASTCRGIDGDSTITGLVEGFQPVLMQRTNSDGSTMLAPHNLVASWFWVYDDASGRTQPVPQTDLAPVFFGAAGYTAEAIRVFDANGDGQIADSELKLDSVEKEEWVASQLQAAGLRYPRVYGQVQPYSIHHNVARGESVTRDCQACHSDSSRLAAPIQISSYIPGSVLPEFSGTNLSASGSLQSNGTALYYQPAPEADGIYVFGHNRVKWVDTLGALAFVGVLFGVSGHAALRLAASRRRPSHRGMTREVYMYSAYERFWHWLQTFTIVLLLFTGLVIHRPDLFGMFSFRHIVTVHNVLAAVLVVNAALSLFWHLVSGEIQQFIPRPYGFFDNAIVQARFYLDGIFKGKAHPFEKTPAKKLNPLQQMTYFGLLNVLLPLQIITGALMWGVQRWPEIAGLFGGLPFLAPFHSLVAWLFAAFIVAHVYLTTTGATVLEDIKAMITGWEKVEISDSLEEGPVAGD